MTISNEPGLRRVAWNLTSDPLRRADAAAAGGRGGRGGGGGGAAGGRGGGGGGAAVAPGRYFAQLVKITSETATPLGTPQSFEVKPLPR